MGDEKATDAKGEIVGRAAGRCAVAARRVRHRGLCRWELLCSVPCIICAAALQSCLGFQRSGFALHWSPGRRVVPVPARAG